MTSRIQQALPSSIALVWAFTAVLHLLTFKWSLPLRWEGIIYSGSTFLLLTRPSSYLRQVTFFAATILTIAWNYEDASNHLVLEFWISISIMGALLTRTLTPERDRPSPFATIAPLLRTQYLITFGFAAFSKLNRDFLDPEWSCAAVFAKQTIEFLKLEPLSFGLLSPDRPSVAFIAIYLTIACEIVIPCLLIFRKTRFSGIYLALAFHFALGFVPILGISSFSALSFTLLLFFFPTSALQLIEQRLAGLAQAFGQKRHAQLLAPLGIALFLCFTVYLQYRFYHPAAAPIALGVWLIAYLPFLYLATTALQQTSKRQTSQAPTTLGSYFFPRPAFLTVFNLPLIAIGILPYLGLQTQGSFTMFSNLRVFGDRPNHFILKHIVPVHTPTLITILSTNHPELAMYPNTGLILTSHELRRNVTETESDFFALCQYEGKIELIGRFEGRLTPHPLLLPLPYFPNSWIRYRDVSTSEHCECTW